MTGFTFVWLVCRWEVFTEGKSLPPCLLCHITLDFPTVSSAPLCSTVPSPLWCGAWFGHQSLSASQLCTFSSLYHEVCVGQEFPLLSRCARCVSRVESSY